MESDPLLGVSSDSVASSETNPKVVKTPVPIGKRIVGLLLGVLGAVIIFNFLLLPGPKEKIHFDFQLRDIVWSDINFLHTTDTHGWYLGHLNQNTYHANWGDFISFASRLRDIAKVNNQDLLLVDTGDRHDGNGFSDITVPNGKKSLPIFIEQDYDLITIGNHELYEYENSKLEYELVVPKYGEKYVCSNVEYKLSNGSFVPFGSKYRYFKTPQKGIRILSFAFLFNFDRYNNGTRVTPILESVKQEWFQQVIEQYPPSEVDLLVVFGHIPVTHSWDEMVYLHDLFRVKYPNTKIQYFGGHSHVRDFTVYDENAAGLQSGRFCETVGWASVKMNKSLFSSKNQDAIESAKEVFHRSYLDFNINSFYHHARATSPKEFDTAKGLNVTERIFYLRKKLGLEKELGQVTKNNYYVSYVPIDHNQSIFKFLTEKVLYTLPTSKTSKSENRLIIINTGSIRYDLYKGPYTVDTQFIVSPFENDWVKVTIPKKLAVQIAPLLNKATYIIAGEVEKLSPPHLWSVTEPPMHANSLEDLETLKTSKPPRMPKGYVTVDDFGHTGDDTPHRPVVNYPVPNVVESVQIEDSADDNTPIDVVFYSFLTKNIIWALGKLKYDEKVEIEVYSKVYLGALLTSYVQKNGA